MKTPKKSRLARAMLAATTGLSMVALMAPAEAREVEDEFQKDVLIYPYYTVRDGWTTLANVTNTTPFTLALKVRYRESNNSRDVLDFNLILSPFDVWTGWVHEGPNGPRLSTRDTSCTTPIFETAGDGSKYADMSNLGYQNDGGPKDIDRAREGHFEFITMAQFYPGSEDETWPASGSVSSDSAGWPSDSALEPRRFNPENSTDKTISWSEGDPKYPTAYYAKHVNGKPRNCEMVDSRFEATTSPFDIDDVVEGKDWSSDGNPLAEWDNRVNRAYWPCMYSHDSIPSCTKAYQAENALKGNFGLVNVAQGIAAGGIAHAVESDFCKYDDEDLITAQEFPWFLEPTLYSRCDNETSGWGGDGGLWGWNTDISDALDVAAANNEWSFNANTGAATDWVVTLPTKEFHVDISETDIYAGANPVRLINDDQCEWNGPAAKPWNCDNIEDNGSHPDSATFEEAFLLGGGLCWSEDRCFEETFGESEDGQSCDTVVYNLWDREEEGVQGSGTSISPAPPQPTDSMCYETNVLSFQGDSVLGSDLAVEVDTSVLTSGASAGWLKLQMGTDCNFSDWTHRDDYCDDDELPAIGFAVKARDFGDPTRNFGVLMDHGYDD